MMFISDVNECHEGEDPCKVNEECSNEEGTYYCFCKLGYKKKNNVCVKKGESSKINYQQWVLLSTMNFLVTLSK